MSDKEIIHLVLDTCILRQDPEFKKKASHQLEKLAKHRRVQLYITDIIKREFITDQINQRKDAINEASNKLEKLSKKIVTSEEARNLLDAQKSIKNLEKELTESCQQRFEKWIILNRVKVLTEMERHTNLVFDSYFSGVHPFSSLKSRKDIPDAFSYYSILDLSEKVEEVFFCTGDENFFNSFSSKKNIRTLKKLEEFIGLKICQDLLLKIENEERQSSKFKRNLEINNNSILRYLNENLNPNDLCNLNLVLEKEIKFAEIDYDDFDAEIIEFLSIISFIIDPNFCGDDDSYTSSFTSEVDVRIEYKISKEDYYHQPNSWRTYDVLLEQQNEKYFRVNTDVNLTVNGEINIDLNPIFNPVNSLEEKILNDSDISSMIRFANVTLLVDEIS